MFNSGFGFFPMHILSLAKVKSFYSKASLAVIFLFPLIFFFPQQYYKNLYVSIPCWIAIGLGIILLPQAIKKAKSAPPFVLISVLGYITAFNITTLFSTDIFLSFPILLLNIAYMAIFFGAASILNTQKLKELFIGIFLIVVLILCIISFYFTLIKRYVNLEPEGLSFMWGYYGHNHLAVLLLVAIPLCFLFIYEYYRILFLRLSFILLLLVFIYSLLITHSRGATISLFISLVIGAVFLQRFLKNSVKKLSQLLTAGLLLLVLFVACLIFYLKFPSGMESRIFHWQKGVEVFLQNPISGSGPGTYRIIPKYNENFKYVQSDYPLNLIIQTASDTGLLGLISGASLYGLLIYKCLLNIKTEPSLSIAIGLGLIGIVLNELVDFDLQLPAVGVLFWILAGLICFRDVADKTNKVKLQSKF